MAYIGKTPSQATRSRFYYTATGGETSLSGADDNSNTLVFSDGNFVDVMLNGVTLVAGTDYNTTTANTIGGLTALVASDVVEIIVYDTFSVFGGDVKGDFTIQNGTLTAGAVSVESLSTTGDVTFGDNDKAIFGGSSDFEIFHDPTAAVNKIVGNYHPIHFLHGSEKLMVLDDDADVQLYYNNALKLATTATGIDVTGTVTADGLTVDGDLTFVGTQYINSDGSVIIGIDTNNDQTTKEFEIYTNGNTSEKRFRVTEGGDISFYEDTGTTPKLFWDASAESLGIGTSSPAAFRLDVTDDVTGDAKNLLLSNEDATVGNTACLFFAPANGVAGAAIKAEAIEDFTTSANRTADLVFETRKDGTFNERMRIDSSGNVGIGTNSPARQLDIYDDGTNGQSVLAITAQNTDSSRIMFADTNDNNIGILDYAHSDNSMRFTVNNSEAMRIDSSGDLLIGKTSNSSNTVGIELFSTGQLVSTADGDEVIIVNRKSSDGKIIGIRKDNSEAGSIHVINSGEDLFIGRSSGTGINFGSGRIQPSTDGVAADNVYDMGHPEYRWDDVYATNGAIQTSDRNEKQDIASLTTAEMAVAARLANQFKTFRWIDSVIEKGDNARTHAGIIAQDVQQAFTDEGLDAGDYALFISNTWWEADEDYTDDDGVAQTRTNTYETADEAPEGATERTRMGIRYPELLSFMQAYNDQRMTSIEARLDALEGN